MHEEEAPVIGQRAHYAGIGFGTIRAIEGREQEGGSARASTHLGIAFDADSDMQAREERLRWKPLCEGELLPLTPGKD